MFLLPDLSGGGAERAVVNLLNPLSARGYKLTLVVGVRQGAYLADVPPGIELISLDRQRSFQRLIPLIRVLRQRRPDVLISTLQQNNVLAIWARLLSGTRTRVILRQGTPLTARQTGPVASKLDRAISGLYRFSYPMADALIATSRGVADDLVKNVSVAREKIALIFNGVISPGFYDRSMEDVSHPFFANGGPPVFLGVGRLSPEKGFTTLVDAFALFRKTAPARLVFLGEGPSRPELEARCASLGIANDVAFLGFQRNPYAYMRRATALVASSLYEGFGNVLAEALALGTFTISTNCPGGPADILDRGRFGLLVPVGDAAAMADAMRRAARQETSFPGQKEWAQQFTAEHAADRYANVIDEVCSGSGPVVAAPKDFTAGTSTAARKSLAFFMPNLAGGGAERSTLNLIPALKERGYDVGLIVGNLEGELRDNIPSELAVTNFDVARTWRTLFPLVRYLRRHKPDVLLSALGHNNMIAVWARALAGVKTKVVICQHGMLSHHSREKSDYRYKLLPYLYRWFAPWADAIVNVSQGAADDLAQITGLKRSFINVINNPVVPPEFETLASQQIDHPFFRSGVPVFLAVGRLVDSKDFQMLIDAFALFRQKRDARLIVLGDGALREPLERFAAQRQVANDISFVGFVHNPLPYMRQASAVLVSSRFESFGNVIIEALAAGTPVVSTDCPSGPAEILDHGRYGTLVPVGDAAAMAAAMGDAVDHPMPKDAAKARGFDFTVEKIASKYVDLIESLA